MLQLQPCCLPGPAHPGMGPAAQGLEGSGSSRNGNALAALGLGGEDGWNRESTLPAQPWHMELMFWESWGCPCLMLPHTRAHPEPHSSPSVPSPAEPGPKLELEVLQIHHSLLTFLQGALSFPSLNQAIQVLPIWVPLVWGSHPGHDTQHHSCSWDDAAILIPRTLLYQEHGAPGIPIPPNVPAPRTWLPPASQSPKILLQQGHGHPQHPNSPKCSSSAGLAAAPLPSGIQPRAS